jgi:hypothetical protein
MITRYDWARQSNKSSLLGTSRFGSRPHQRIPKPKVTGSSPVGTASTFKELAVRNEKAKVGFAPILRGRERGGAVIISAAERSLLKARFTPDREQ